MNGTHVSAAIFRGRRCRMVRTNQTGVWLAATEGTTRFFVAALDPDLIVSPSSADLELADAFERGEINAFEYSDGHTFPRNHEIPGAEHGPQNAARIH